MPPAREDNSKWSEDRGRGRGRGGQCAWLLEVCTDARHPRAYAQADWRQGAEPCKAGGGGWGGHKKHGRGPHLAAGTRCYTLGPFPGGRRWRARTARRLRQVKDQLPVSDGVVRPHKQCERGGVVLKARLLLASAPARQVQQLGATADRGCLQLSRPPPHEPCTAHHGHLN